MIQRFARVARRYGDFDFLDRGGILDLRRSVAGARQLRIESPVTTPLRLASVLIDADGLEDAVGQTARRASSAQSPEAAKKLRDGLLFDLRNTEVSVHTRADHRPWLEIDFDRPVQLRRLRLRNVNDADSVSARGIQVLVRTEDGHWRTLYDGLARQRAFVRDVERESLGETVSQRLRALAGGRLGKGLPAPIGPHGADLAKILTTIHCRDTDSLFRDLDRIGLSGDQVSEFRGLVTAELLRQRELEWNIHGIKRSFRYWSLEEKRAYLSFALEVMDALREINENVCFGFGSVLSVVRDHDLIPHDDDLDVLIAFEPTDAPTLASGLELIKKVLVAKGFLVEGNFTSYHWVFPPGRTMQKLDAFVGIFEDDRIAWYPGKRGALTRDMMFPGRTVPLLGLECPVPNRPQEYLKQIYGPGWSSPDPHFRHTWKRSEYADIAR